MRLAEPQATSRSSRRRSHGSRSRHPLSKGKKGKNAKRKSRRGAAQSAKKKGKEAVTSGALATATPIVVKGPAPMEEKLDESPSGVEGVPATVQRDGSPRREVVPMSWRSPGRRRRQRAAACHRRRFGEADCAAKLPPRIRPHRHRLKARAASAAPAASIFGAAKLAASPLRTARSPATAMKGGKSPARKPAQSPAAHRRSHHRPLSAGSYHGQVAEAKALPQLTASFLVEPDSRPQRRSRRRQSDQDQSRAARRHTRSSSMNIRVRASTKRLSQTPRRRCAEQPHVMPLTARSARSTQRGWLRPSSRKRSPRL